MTKKTNQRTVVVVVARTTHCWGRCYTGGRAEPRKMKMSQLCKTRGRSSRQEMNPEKGKILAFREAERWYPDVYSLVGNERVSRKAEVRTRGLGGQEEFASPGRNGRPWGNGKPLEVSQENDTMSLKALESSFSCHAECGLEQSDGSLQPTQRFTWIAAVRGG